MKISRFPGLKTTPVLTSVAFTLIELLVVISIIAVLASLSMGAASGVQLAAKKASAKNDLSEIVTAVKSYYVDYGQYPPPSSAPQTTDYCYGPSTLAKGNTNDKLMDVLRYPPGFTDPNSLNPRQIKYLEVSDVKNTANPVSGIVKTTGAQGPWVDPWGVQYVVFIDADYDSCITISSVFSGNQLGTSGTVAISAGAASVGLYINKTGKTGAHAYNKSYDLLSWQ